MIRVKIRSVLHGDTRCTASSYNTTTDSLEVPVSLVLVLSEHCNTSLVNPGSLSSPFNGANSLSSSTIFGFRPEIDVISHPYIK